MDIEEFQEFKKEFVEHLEGEEVENTNDYLQSILVRDFEAAAKSKSLARLARATILKINEEESRRLI